MWRVQPAARHDTAARRLKPVEFLDRCTARTNPPTVGTAGVCLTKTCHFSLAPKKALSEALLGIVMSHIL
jgi:hypothetical protein